jgi:uncharacterized protein (DUF2126 family)
MQVTRVWEAPRVTKPYTEEQWNAIENLGHQIDETLQEARRAPDPGRRADLRRGRRPGRRRMEYRCPRPDQADLRAEIFHRLREYYAPNGLMHFGQGKWYPGEQLPRWSLNCFWRKDGEPIWNSPALYANESVDYGVTSRAGRTIPEARRESAWGSTDEYVFPAFEDAYLLHVARAPPAGQRRSLRFAGRRPAGARAPDEGVHPGHDPCRRPCRCRS